MQRGILYGSFLARSVRPLLYNMPRILTLYPQHATGGGGTYCKLCGNPTSTNDHERRARSNEEPSRPSPRRTEWLIWLRSDLVPSEALDIGISWFVLKVSSYRLAKLTASFASDYVKLSGHALFLQRS